MAENFDIQQKINNFLTSHSDLKGKSEEVILSAMMEEGVVTQAEINSAKSTSAFGFGFNKTGDTGLSVESGENAAVDTNAEIKNGIEKFKDDAGNTIVMKYDNGLLMEKTISKNNIQSAKTTYTYAGNGCVIAETQNSDQSKTVVIGNSVDENGNIPDEDFICSETTNKNGESSSVYMTYYGMVKQEIKNNTESTTIYATSNYSEVKNETAQKISETQQNANGNGIVTKYNADGTSEKYAQIILVKGESVSELAKRFGTTVEQIKELNPHIDDINKVKIGTPIVLENKSNVPEEETLNRKNQQQITYEGYTQAYQNIISKHNKQTEITFPVDVNGKQTDKFNNLHDAAKYVLALNNVKNPSKEQIDICVKELTILNSSSDEKSITKRANEALINLNSGNLTYVSNTDFSAELLKCGFKPTTQNYAFYQKFYAVREQLLDIRFAGAEGDAVAVRDISEKLDKIIKEEGEKVNSNPENVKYRILTECGINLYEDAKAAEADDILKRKMALDISSNVYEYLYRANDNIVNGGSLSRDIQNLLEEGADAVAQKFGKDVYTRKEYIEDLKKVNDIIDLMSETDLRKSEEFNKLFKEFYGVEYNKESIERLYEILADSKDKNFNEILDDEEFQKLFSETFNMDLHSRLTDLTVSEWGSKITDIMIMVVAFQLINKSPAMQNFSLNTASTLNNIGMTGKWLQLTQAAIVGGASFATYTAAEKLGDLMLRGEELDANNSERIAQNMLESFEFGAFAGTFNVLASYGFNAILQKPLVQQAVSSIEKIMPKGSITTGTELMKGFYNAQDVLIKTSHFAYSFGTNVVGFTTYNTAKDMIHNMDKVKELGFGKYLGQQFLAQLQGLATFEGVKMFLAFAMSGKIGMESAMSIADSVDKFETLKNMAIVTVEDNGQTCYLVTYPQGKPMLLRSMGEVVALCQSWMVGEYNVRSTLVSDPMTDKVIIEDHIALPTPNKALPESTTSALINPYVAVSPETLALNPASNPKILMPGVTPTAQPVPETGAKPMVQAQPILSVSEFEAKILQEQVLCLDGSTIQRFYDWDIDKLVKQYKENPEIINRLVFEREMFADGTSQPRFDMQDIKQVISVYRNHPELVGRFLDEQIAGPGGILQPRFNACEIRDLVYLYEKNTELVERLFQDKYVNSDGNARPRFGAYQIKEIVALYEETPDIVERFLQEQEVGSDGIFRPRFSDYDIEYLVQAYSEDPEFTEKLLQETEEGADGKSVPKYGAYEIKNLAKIHKGNPTLVERFMQEKIPGYGGSAQIPRFDYSSLEVIVQTYSKDPVFVEKLLKQTKIDFDGISRPKFDADGIKDMVALYSDYADRISEVDFCAFELNSEPDQIREMLDNGDLISKLKNGIEEAREKFQIEKSTLHMAAGENILTLLVGSMSYGDDSFIRITDDAGNVFKFDRNTGSITSVVKGNKTFNIRDGIATSSQVVRELDIERLGIPEEYKEEVLATFKNLTPEQIQLAERKAGITRSIEVVINKLTGEEVSHQLMQESPIRGEYEIWQYGSNGKNLIGLAEYDANGGRHIEKHLTSLNGTTTDTVYADDADGNSFFTYRITDANGKVLYESSKVHKVLGDNHYQTWEDPQIVRDNNGKATGTQCKNGFDVQITDNKVIITRLDANRQLTSDVVEFAIADFTPDMYAKVNEQAQEPKLNQPKWDAQLTRVMSDIGISEFTVDRALLPMLKKMSGAQWIQLKGNNTRYIVGGSFDPNNACSTGGLVSIGTAHEGILPVFLHEAGHERFSAFDFVNDPELKGIYEREKALFTASFSDDMIAPIEYFLFANSIQGTQGTEQEQRGLNETTAETNALTNTPQEWDLIQGRTAILQQYFPETIAYISNKLNSTDLVPLSEQGTPSSASISQIISDDVMNIMASSTPAPVKPVAETLPAPLAGPLTSDIVLNQLRSLGTNEELIESFARNIDNGYINLETCKDLFLAVKDDPEILTDYFGLLMFEGLRPENISAKIEIYEALKDSKIRPIDKIEILFKTEQGNIEEVRQEVSFRKHLEELYDENIDLQNRRDDHVVYLNACTQHNGYEFVNNNLELIIRNLGIAYYIREENLPLARAIDEYTVATKKEFEPRRIEEMFSSSAEQQAQVINELHQELVKIEEINGKLERQEAISRDEAAQMIGLIFHEEPRIISEADDILKHFNNDGLISADAIKLIKQLKEYFEQNSKYTADIPGDVKNLLRKAFKNGRIATEEDITSLSKLIQISQTENSADNRIELDRYVQAIQKADGSLDGSKVEQAIESGLTISECLNIFDNFSRYDIFTHKYSNDIEGYNKALEIAIALSDQSPEMRNFFIKYFIGKNFESYTDFVENPGETVKFIEKLIELGFINKDSFIFRDGIMRASLPIEPVQLKALELLSGINITDNYIDSVYKYLDSIQESELPVIKDILNKYASNLPLSRLGSIREISKFYANSNSEIQEALIKAVHKGVFEYDHDGSFCSNMGFLNALQTRPKAITALLDSNIKGNNIDNWRFLLEFLEGDPTPISDEQASFYFGLISKTPLASEISRYDLCKGAIYRALISLDPKYYGEIEDLVLSGANPISTIVSVNNAVAKNPNAISETKSFIANNPQIAEILEGHTSIILENIDNIKLLAHRPDIVKGLFDDGMLEDLIGYEGITAEMINRSIQAADKISPETKSILPRSAARVFTIQAYVEAFGGGDNKKGLVQSFVDAHNKLATYDLNFANGISDLIFSHMREFVNAGRISNIDYIYDYVVNEGDSEEFILKALFIETDMYELESYCKELNLDTDAKNALILDIMNISILKNNIDVIRLDEKIDWYNKLQNIDDVQRYICSRVGIDVDNIMSKLQSMIGSPRAVITTPPESQNGFLHDIIANNNQVTENILRTMDFESFGKTGLPLKYSREEFTANIIKLLENLSPNEQELILRHFYLEKGQKGFDGIPTNLPFNEEGASDEVKAVAHRVQQEINKFSLENEVVTGDPTVDKIFTSLIQGLPEFTSIVGKEQHDTHSYSVDIHSLKVLQSAMNNPLYQQLSDQDKTILKFAILLHDTGKKGGVRDAGHASLSAEFVAGILEKYPFPEGVKDRIIDIVENHHWFEGYNTGIASPAEVAIHCRRPEDYLIYQIFAKADLENVSSTFHYVVTGTSTPEEYAAFMQDKTQAIGQALQQMYSKSNLIFDTKFVRKGELFPLESATVNGTEMQFRVLDLNKIDDNASLQPFGFEPGTTKSNARFFVHMTNPNREDMEPVKILTGNSLNGSTWSTSLIQPHNNRTYQDRQFGFILDVDQSNISAAYYENIGSGCGKSIKDFEDFIFASDNLPARMFVRSSLIELLKERGIELSDEEYAVLSKKMISKKYIHQIKDDIVIGDKTIKPEVLTECLEISRDRLFEGGNIHSEIVPINPRIIGLVAKVESLSQCPEEFLEFAHENNLPIIIMKEEHED